MLLYVRNKFNIETFLTSNRCFWLNYKFESIILLPPVKKVISSKSGEKYATINKQKQSKTHLDVRGQQGMEFFGLWTCILGRSDGLSEENVDDFAPYKNTPFHFTRLH